jgi:hypothetical protein
VPSPARWSKSNERSLSSGLLALGRAKARTMNRTNKEFYDEEQGFF